MLETLKKKSFKSSLVFSVILLIAGCALVFYHLGNAISVFTGYTDFTTLAPEEIRSQLVDVELYQNMGCFMESGTQDKNTRRVSISHYYYIIYTGAYDDPDTEYKFMAIKVPRDFGSKMDAMTEATYNGLLSNPLSFSGKIRKFDSDETKYFNEYMRDAGFTDAEIEAETLPYCIDVFKNGKTGWNIFYIVLFAGGIFLIGWAVFRIVKASKGGYMKNFLQAIEQSGCSESYVESDMNSAVFYDKKGTFRIGRLFTYYSLFSTEPSAIPNSKIMWAYQTTTTHRTNGIKTGTTYSIMVWVEGRKNAISISVADEGTAQKALQQLSDTCPWIVVGYSDDLKSLFNKNREQFLQLRYNTVEHTATDPAYNPNYNS